MTEHWLPIEDYPDYEISDYSRVRSHKGPSLRILKYSVDKNDYHCYHLYNDQGSKDIKAHVLVALAFIGPRPEGMLVRHKDGVPSNNHVSNLEYGTALDNKADCIAHGTHGRKLTERKVKVIRGLRKVGFTVNRLAIIFSVNRNTIIRVSRKHTWTFVD